VLAAEVWVPVFPFVQTTVPKQPGSLEEILAQKVANGEMSMEDAAAAKRSMSPSSIPKPRNPPAGYREAGDGYEPVPGGPADEKVRAQKAQAEAKLQGNLDKSQLIISKIDKALSQVGPWTTGLGGMLKHIPATPAKDLAETLQTVRSNVGFETLNEMREASRTGGALGQVSDRENALLQAVRGSLEQEQSIPQINENLKQIRDHYFKVSMIAKYKTEDPEANNAIAQVLESAASPAEKQARIQAINSAAMSGQ
jgi:hypothetical protein